MVQGMQDQGGQRVTAETRVVAAFRPATGRNVCRCPLVRTASQANRPAQERATAREPCRQQSLGNKTTRAQIPPIPKSVVVAGSALPQETEAKRPGQRRRQECVTELAHDSAAELPAPPESAEVLSDVEPMHTGHPEKITAENPDLSGFGGKSQQAHIALGCA